MKDGVGQVCSGGHEATRQSGQFGQPGQLTGGEQVGHGSQGGQELGVGQDGDVFTGIDTEQGVLVGHVG